MKKWFSIVFIGIVFLPLISCRYHFAGDHKPFLENIRSVYIPIFKNETFESGIEEYFTNAFRKEFMESSRITLAGKHEADMIIHGKIKDFKVSPLSFDRNNVAIEYRSTVLVEIACIDKVGNPIRANEMVKASQEFWVSSKIGMTESSRKDATKKIAHDVAEDIHDWIFSSF